MRNYGRVVPTFWTGTTGRAIRAAGRDAQIVALYLITGPNATMTGLYYLPLPTLCHEVGITTRAARKALQALADLGFAHYDEPTAFVWVPEMARYQIGTELKPGDKRIAAIVKSLRPFLGHPFAAEFVAKYAEAFHLPAMPLRCPFDVPSETLRSQEQEQEQDQEQDKEQEQDVALAGGAHHLAPTDQLTPPNLQELWNTIVKTPLCNVMAGERLSRAAARLRAHPDRAFWIDVLTRIAQSPFLCGRVPGKTWRADIDWLLKDDLICETVLEGKYDALGLTGPSMQDRKSEILAELPDD